MSPTFVAACQLAMTWRICSSSERIYMLTFHEAQRANRLWPSAQQRRGNAAPAASKPSVALAGWPARLRYSLSLREGS